MTDDRLTAILTELKLSEHEAGIRDELRPSVRLVHSPDLDASAAGASRFGGDPDLRAGFVWPTYEYERMPTTLSFLAQIDLSSLPRDGVPAEMPTEGLLSVFYDCENTPWGGDPGDEDGLVLAFHEAGIQLTRTAAPEGTERFEAAAIAGVTEETLPESFLDSDLEPEGDDDVCDLEEKIRDALHSKPGAPLHRIGGYDDNIQNPKIEGDDPVLLLQIGTDQLMNWMWGDVGSVYLTISREDLAARRFDRAEYEMQCH